jgi:hypothetical protein
MVIITPLIGFMGDGSISADGVHHKNGPTQSSRNFKVVACSAGPVGGSMIFNLGGGAGMMSRLIPSIDFN